MNPADTLRPCITQWLREHNFPLKGAFQCLNPSHTDKHPSMRYYAQGQNVHCFSCGATYDVFDLVGMEENLTGFPEKVQAVERRYGIPQPVRVTPRALAVRDLSHYRVGEGRMDPYFAARGLSEETVTAYGLRVEGGWAVLPVFIGETCVGLCRRNLRPGAEPRYLNSRGALPLWNMAALENAAAPVFVTEGIFDALSLVECGFPALALCGAANLSKLAAALPRQLPGLIGAGDIDPAGQSMNAGLEALAGERGLPFGRLTLPSGAKDVNEALTTDRAALLAACKAVSMTTTKNAEKKDLTSPERLAGLLLDYAARRGAPLSTGLPGLDEALGGGITPGLTVLGAVSGMGKTTLLLQLADALAAAGREVLFVTVEMSRWELTAKSMTRLSEGTTTAGAILSGREGEQPLTQLAAAYLNATGGRVEFMEPEEPLTPEALTDLMERAVEKRRGIAPILVLDYLQLMAPSRAAATDKQNTDRAVQTLKQLAKRFQTPVITASSFNREAYLGAVGLSAFKESGLVEYSADLLLALQYTGMGESGFDSGKAAAAATRRLTLTVLKNRFGKAGLRVNLHYQPAGERFADAPAQPEQKKSARPILR